MQWSSWPEYSRQQGQARVSSERGESQNKEGPRCPLQQLLLWLRCSRKFNHHIIKEKDGSRPCNRKMEWWMAGRDLLDPRSQSPVHYQNNPNLLFIIKIIPIPMSCSSSRLRSKLWFSEEVTAKGCSLIFVDPFPREAIMNLLSWKWPVLAFMFINRHYGHM